MSETLNDVISKIASVVNQETSVTDTSDEYSLWKSYVNQAQQEWADVYEWQQLLGEYNAITTTPGTNANAATIALPLNFKKLAGFPKITADGTTTNEYMEINPLTKSQYLATEQYCYVLYSRPTTYLIVNPGTIVSGASIFLAYWKSLTSLASPNDVIECPNSEYLIKRSIALIWESREDARFPQVKAEAEKILQRALMFDSAKGVGYDNKIQMIEESKYDFRLGRD